MGKILFALALLALAVSSVQAGALTNAAVTLSNNIGAATAVTTTISFTAAAAIPLSGKITVGLAGFTWPAAPACKFTAPAGTADPAAAAFAANTLTVTLAATAIAAGTVTLTCTGATLPAAQVAKTDVAIKTRLADDSADVDTTAAGTLPQIVGAITGAAVTLSSATAAATGVTVTITGTTTTQIAASGKILTTLTGFVWPATPVCKFTAPAGTADPASSAFASNVLTVTLSAAAVAAGVVTFTCTGATLPAAQLAKTDVVVKTRTTADAEIDASVTGTLVGVVGVLTNGAVTLSTTLAATAAATATISFTSVSAIPASGKITVGLTGFTFGANTCKFTAPAGTADPASSALAANLLTVVLSANALAAGTVTLTCTGVTTPAAQAAKSNIAIKTTTGADADIDTTSSATLPTINLTATLLTNAAVTLSNNVAASTAVTVSVTFTAASAITAAGKIAVTLTGFTWPATPVCTFTAPSALANAAAFAGGVLTVTLNAGVTAAAGTLTFSCTGATLPALQAAKSDVQIVTKSTADANIDSTQGATLSQIVAAITGAAVTLSSTTAAATGVTVTITGTTASQLPASGKILTTLTGFTWPATPVCKFTAPVGTADPTSSAFAANVLTVTLSATAVAAGTVTFTCTGATLPAAQLAKTDVVVRTKTTADADIDGSVTGTLVGVVGVLTNGAVTLSSTVAATAATTATISFTSVSQIPASGKITVGLTSFTWPAAPACKFTAPAGTVDPASSAFAANTLTVTLSANALAAGTVTLTCTGATTPAAQANKSNIVIKTTTGADADIDTTSTATLPTINLTATLLTNAAITLSNNIAAATAVTATISFTSATQIPASGKITVGAAGFTWAAPVCKFTAPTGTTDPASSAYAANVLTVTLSANALAAGTVTLTCTAATLPAIQAAKADIQIVTKTSADANLDSTQVATLPQIVGAITSAAVTLSDQTAAATGATVTITLTTASQLSASGKILTTLTSFAWPATPVCKFTAPAGTADPASSAFADNVLTVTISATAVAAGTITMTCTGATLPAAQLAKTDVNVRTQSSTGANIDASITGTLAAVWGTLTGAAVTLSSSAAAATAVTVTTTFTAIQAISASGKIVIPLNNFAWPAAPACKFTAPSGTADPASSAFAANTLTVTISATAINAGVVTLTCTGATNPATQLALSNLNIKTTTSADATIDRTLTGSLVSITPASGSLGAASITLSNTGAAATSVTVTATFLASQALPANGQIKVTLTGFTASSPVCNITSPSVLTNSAAFATNVLTITVTAGAAAGSTFTFTCTGFTNPAAQVAKTDVAINTANASGTALDSTTSGSLVAVTAVGALTSAAVTLSTGSEKQSPVTVTISFTSATSITASAIISVPLAGFSFAADFACKFTAPAGTADPAKSAFANGGLTVTVGTVAIAAGLTTLTCTGATTPAAQAALTNLAIYTRSSAGNDIDRTATGTLPAITAVGAITGAAVTLSSAVAAATSVTVTVSLTTATQIAASGKIVVPLTGYAFASPVCKFTAPSGTADPTSSAYANGHLTVTISATAIPAGLTTFTCTGATNPASQLAKSDLYVRTVTSADVLIDTTKTASLVAITPAAGALGSPAVTLSNTATVAKAVTVTTTFIGSVALPANGVIRVGLTGFTASSTTCTFTSPSALVNTATVATNGTLSVTVTAGAAAGSTYTFACTGFTNPATQAAKTDVIINTNTAALTATLDSTATGTLVAVTAVGALTGAAITLSNNGNAVSGVTVSVTFTSATAIGAAGSIYTTLAGFGFPSTPVCTFTAPSALANTASFASGVLTVTLNAGVSAAAGAVTFSCTGATNPGAQPALTNVTLWTNAAGTDLDRTAVGSLVNIVVAVSQVAFTTQPSGAIPATKFTTQPVVQLRDATGAVVTTATTNVVLTIKSQTAGVSGTLNGTTTVAAVAGVATFTDVSVSLANTNYVLTATSGKWTADSNSFNAVAAGTATTLVFTTQPTATANTGVAFAAQPVVELRDNANTKASSTASVTLALKGSNATLSGTTTVAAVAGVATFSGLSISAAGTYTLEATSTGLFSATSNSVTVTDLPPSGNAKLYFSAVPGLFATVAKSFSFAVGFQKADASTDPTATATVTLSATGLTSNTTSVTPVRGIASFSGSYAAEGTYTLTVSATGYTSASRTITVQKAATAASKLAFSTQPSAVASARKAFAQQPIVTVQDATGVTVTSSTATITLSGTGLGPASALSAKANAGAVEFATLYLESSAATATVTLTASSTGLTSATSTAIVVSRAFSYIAFSKFPTFETTAVDFSVQPQVTAYASDASAFTTQTGSVVLSSTSTGFTLASSATTGLTATMTAGVASWTGVKATVSTAGSYNLVATLGTNTASTNQLSMYTTAAATSTAKAAEQVQSVQFTVKLALDASIVDDLAKKSATETAIRADFCLAAALPIATCNIQATISKASVSTNVVILNSADSTRASPAKIAAGLSAQMLNANSVLRGTPVVGLVESPSALVVTNSNLRSSSASTASVAVATAVVAGVAAALLL